MNIYETQLNITEEKMVERIVAINTSGHGIISGDYIGAIAEKIVEDVMLDMVVSADVDEWNDDDVRLAVGRVLCAKLGIEV